MLINAILYLWMTTAAFAAVFPYRAGDAFGKDRGLMPVDDADNEGLIVGGETAAIGDYPYFVTLYPEAGCGASLIAPRVVLTAAHCTCNEIRDPITNRRLGCDGYRKQQFVVAGVFYRPLTTNWLTDGAVVRSVVEQRDHEEYDHLSLENDLTLMLLNEDAVPNVDSDVILRLSNDPADMLGPVTAIGLGRLFSNQQEGLPNELQEVELSGRSDAFCEGQWGTTFKRDVMMCAGVNGGNKSTCQVRPRALID